MQHHLAADHDNEDDPLQHLGDAGGVDLVGADEQAAEEVRRYIAGEPPRNPC